MQTATGSKEALILYKNEEKILNDVSEALRYAHLFQPFINALFENRFNNKPTIGKVCEIILNKDLAEFLRAETLALTPEIDKLPISRKKKLELIEPEDKFNNLAELNRLFDLLPRGSYERSQILNFELDENDKLCLPVSSVDEIIARNTVYADTPEQKQAFDRASNILEQAKTLFNECGVNLFSPHYPLVYGVHDLTCKAWRIEPHAVKKQLDPKTIEHVKFLINNK